MYKLNFTSKCFMHNCNCGSNIVWVLLLLYVVLLWYVMMIVHGSSQLRGKRTCPLGVSTYFVRQDDACRLISEGQAPLAGSRGKDEDSIASQSLGELIS
jgi:hypothetical protein